MRLNAVPAVSDIAESEKRNQMSNRTIRIIFYLATLLPLSCATPGRLSQKAAGPSGYDGYACQHFLTEGIRQLGAGNFDSAMDLMRYCLELDTASAAACYYLAECYMNAGDREIPGKLLQKAVRIEPDNYWYRRLLAINYTRLHKMKDAIAQYEEMIRRFPGRSDLILEVAALYEETGQFEKELRALDRYGKLEDVADELQIQRFLCYLQMGELDSAYYEADRPAEIIELLMNSVNSAAGYDMVARFSSVVSQHEPGLADPYYYTAIIRYQTDSHEKGVSILDNGLQFVHDNAGRAKLFSLRGEFHHEMGMGSEMYQDYDSVLVYDPDNIGALNNYAYFLSLEDRDLDRALQMSARTVEEEPFNPTYLDTYAWVLFRMKRYEECLSYLEKALRYLDTENPDIYEHYGDALFMCGEKEKAMEYWHKAVQLNSTSKTLDRKIHEQKYIE